ncbi:hypothetical protein CK203_062529 [Vitis vinifera]|uniref:Uncharacterized protein n=1 Tax=Vitis vinifera TaxID=29760 RepID=A0A438FWV4_VITVI|nr:hypothetical protein CK203_062529 [Vitis vinifera]
MDWKRNLDVALTIEELKWVTQEEMDNYHSWQREDQKTKCIIFESLDNVLQHQHVSMPTTHDILVNLHEMLGGKSRPIKQATLNAIMDAKMSKETLIRDLMIYIIELINEMEILGFEIIDK